MVQSKGGKKRREEWSEANGEMRREMRGSDNREGSSWRGGDDEEEDV